MSSAPNSPEAPRQLSGPVSPVGSITPTSPPLRQLQELPKDELEHLAEDLGLDPTRYKSRQHLVAAIHERRQMIAAMDRQAMLDVVRWGRRAVPANASKEQLALEIARIRSMRFGGLSQPGLVVLAAMRGVPLHGDEDVPALVRKLRKQEGFFSRMNRKRRAMIGSIVSNMLGEDEDRDYQFLPPQQPGAPPAPAGPAAGPQSSIKEEIEESGLFGGLASRVKKTADTYLNQKLDEIEARIDRKLDEIDRRLAEWRDKEIANRIRILKITLWASVIVAALSLVYSYVTTYVSGGGGRPARPTTAPASALAASIRPLSKSAGPAPAPSSPRTRAPADRQRDAKAAGTIARLDLIPFRSAMRDRDAILHRPIGVLPDRRLYLAGGGGPAAAAPRTGDLDRHHRVCDTV